MASPFELRRRHVRVYRALMLAGACSLLGLNLLHALHHAEDAHCEAELSGDPFDCFICNALHHLGPPPLVVAFALPAPQRGEVLPPLAQERAPATCPLAPTAARAPPSTVL